MRIASRVSDKSLGKWYLLNHILRYIHVYEAQISQGFTKKTLGGGVEKKIFQGFTNKIIGLGAGLNKYLRGLTRK